jgi:hypothetical protein
MECQEEGAAPITSPAEQIQGVCRVSHGGRHLDGGSGGCDLILSELKQYVKHFNMRRFNKFVGLWYGGCQF